MLSSNPIVESSNWKLSLQRSICQCYTFPDVHFTTRARNLANNCWSHFICKPLRQVTAGVCDYFRRWTSQTYTLKLHFFIETWWTLDVYSYVFVFGGLLVLGRWHHKVWRVAIKTALKCCYSPKSCWNLLRPLSEQGILWIMWREWKSSTICVCWISVEIEGQTQSHPDSCPTLERNLSSNFFLNCEVNGVMHVFNLIFWCWTDYRFCTQSTCLVPRGSKCIITIWKPIIWDLL